jgi:uncharacterized protein (DUF1330 family)
MAPGYWIFHADIADRKAFAAYTSATAAAFAKYGARLIVRGGNQDIVEGKARSRTAVMAFKDYETALACYRSPEYQTAKQLRQGASDCDVVVIEGCDEPASG